MCTNGVVVRRQANTDAITSQSNVESEDQRRFEFYNYQLGATVLRAHFLLHSTSFAVTGEHTIRLCTEQRGDDEVPTKKRVVNAYIRHATQRSLACHAIRPRWPSDAVQFKTPRRCPLMCWYSTHRETLRNEKSGHTYNQHNTS